MSEDREIARYYLDVIDRGGKYGMVPVNVWPFINDFLPLADYPPSTKEEVVNLLKDIQEYA